MRWRFASIPALLLAFVASGQEVTRAPFPIAETRIGFAPSQRENPKVAASDDRFLVIWQDYREGTGEQRVWATRVMPDGTVLDPLGFPIDEPARPFAHDVVQSIASDGKDFLVVLRREGMLRLVKVTSDGVVQRAPDPGLSIYNASLAWVGDAYALLFSAKDSETSNFRGRAVILDRDGRVTTPAWDIVSSTGPVPYVAAAAAGQGVLVMWTDHNDNRVHAAPTSKADLRSGATRFVVSTQRDAARPAPWALAASGGGNRYLATWIEGEEYKGRVLNETGLPEGDVITLSGRALAGSLDVTWNGSRFVVAHTAFEEGERKLQVSEIDPNTNAVTPVPREKTSCSIGVGVASTSGRTLVAWEPDSIGSTVVRDQIHADILGFSASPGLLLSRSVVPRSLIAACWARDHYVAVWYESSYPSHLAVGRFTVDGRPLDGAGRILENGGLASMATDGSSALLVYRASGNVHAALISPDGRVTNQILPGRKGTPNVIWDGGQYVVHTVGALTRLSTDGVVLEDVKLPVEAWDSATLTWTGTNYLLFWTTSEICFPICVPPVSLWMLTISSDLMPLGSPRRLAYPEGGIPVVAQSGRDVLVSWRTGYEEVYAARVTDEGFVLDPENGFRVGDATWISEVIADADGWTVVQGPYAWKVSKDRIVSERSVLYPFVWERGSSRTIFGGPFPLVLYHTAPGDEAQVTQLYGRFLVPPKRRAVR